MTATIHPHTSDMIYTIGKILAYLPKDQRIPHTEHCIVQSKQSLISYTILKSHLESLPLSPNAVSTLSLLEFQVSNCLNIHPCDTDTLHNTISEIQSILLSLIPSHTPEYLKVLRKYPGLEL